MAVNTWTQRTEKPAEKPAASASATFVKLKRGDLPFSNVEDQ
ncbi:hypothetical protein [Parabacteroides bouchesdurhonensis]|nr:hypothetical protein [Parabacteroides bouchesdurhonensis]